MQSVRVVGLGGGTASGKSTLAETLARHLGARCALLKHDWYYWTLPESSRSEPVMYNFDHPSALDSARLVRDLQTLRSGKPARVPVYDFSSHSRCPESEWSTVSPRPVVIVEGILVLTDPVLRALFDHAVYVEAPESVRLERRVARDQAHRGRSHEAVLEQYHRTVRPMHDKYVAPCRAHADLVLCGTDPVEESLSKLLALLGE